MIEQHEFSVISLYKPSESLSVEVHGFLEEAKEFLEAKTSAGAWSQRNVGWFKVNLDQDPELKIDEKGRSTQAVLGHG